MKFLVIVTVAISLLCFAAAITSTAYSDNNCGTVTASVVEASGSCISTGLSSRKWTSCKSGGSAVTTAYVGTSCATEAGSVTFPVDVCISTSSSTSTKITCAPASSVNVALAAVAAAAVLLFVQ
jgi:hypothetical protein